jgi:lipopolysaccharide biosynthesis glycosyltransferase
MLHSLYSSNRKHDIFIHILDGGISLKNRLKLSIFLKRIKFKFKYYKIDYGKIKNAPISNHISLASYNRIFLSTVISNKIDKILYLDCDLVVLKDIQSFYEFNLDDYYLGAVREIVNEEAKQRLELGEEFNYFNAGVQIVNLKKWRQDKFEDILIDFILNKTEKIVYHDQDTMNYCARGKWLELSYHHNATHFFYFSHKYSSSYFGISDPLYEDIKTNPIVVHYTSQSKPWHSDCLHPKKELFFKYELNFRQIIFNELISQ